MTDPHDFDEFEPDSLRQLNDALHSLPRESAPLQDAWPTIQARIERARVHKLIPEAVRFDAPAAAGRAAAVSSQHDAPVTHTVSKNTSVKSVHSAARKPSRSPWIKTAAVAATLVIAFTAYRVQRANRDSVSQNGLTHLPTLAAGETKLETIAEPPVSSAPMAASETSAAALAETQVLDRYAAAASDLASEFNSRRDRLDTETAAILDSCLHTIDAAIAESRVALKQSPENATIADLLTVTYEQKIDLLRRASELPLRSLQDLP